VRDSISNSTETLIHASKEIGVEINVEKIKYMLLSRHQNVGQNWDIKILKHAESSCEFGIEPSGSMKCWETIEWA
jgi:hypothetical protein